MSGHQSATLGDTVYFWFAANDTSGSGNDGASAVYDVREAGAAADAAPLLSGSATLLSHANYPAGCYEVAVAATSGNGFAASDTFAVFATLAVDSQNPTGIVGSCTLTPLATAASITALDAVVDTVKVDTAAILVDTNELQGDDVPGLISTLDAVVDTVKVDTAAILVDTNELQGDWTNGGRLDVIIDAILADTNELQGDDVPGLISTLDAVVDTVKVDTAAILVDTNELQGDDVPGLISTLDAVVDTVKAETVLILADTNELQGDWTNGGRLDVIIDAILADTNELQGDDVPGLISTLDAVVDTVKVDTAAILVDTNELQGDDVPGLISTLDAVVDTVKAETVLILADTNELQGDWANGGRLDLLLDAIPTTAMRGTDSAATATNLATVDTVVDAIKAVTDQMVFTKANELDANTQSINGAEVTGDGNATPWDGA